MLDVGRSFFDYLEQTIDLRQTSCGNEMKRIKMKKKMKKNKNETIAKTNGSRMKRISKTNGNERITRS